MIDRRLIANFDWGLLIITIVISTIGVLIIYSSVYGRIEPNLKGIHIKQIYWILCGLFGIFFIILFDYNSLERYVYFLYFSMIFLLVYLLLYGKVVAGTQRWIFLGPISFQPSELMKLVLIIVLAKHFSNRKRSDSLYLRELIFPFIIVLIPFLLVAKQPDLGTAFMFFFIFFTLVFIVGLKFKSFLYLIFTGMFFLPSMWFFLQDYQKKRLLTLLDPYADPLGAGYHSLQSMIAIGSGGLWGKGLFAGTQSRLNFLPAKHTDFIFSVLAEEWGFIGAFTLVILYLIFLLTAIDISYRSRDDFGYYLAIGIVGMMGFYIMMNIGMTLGIIPIVGLPLPLMSYGGSSIFTTMLAVGLLLSIRMRRFKY